MARYIDADALTEKLQETICSKCNMYDGIKCKSCGIDDTLDFLENTPTADVVPKSEVEREYGNALQTAFNDGRLEGGKEVAREIFEEIEKITMHNVTSSYGIWLMSMGEDAFAELKKKYTEGEQ